MDIMLYSPLMQPQHSFTSTTYRRVLMLGAKLFMAYGASRSIRERIHPQLSILRDAIHQSLHNWLTYINYPVSPSFSTCIPRTLDFTIMEANGSAYLGDMVELDMYPDFFMTNNDYHPRRWPWDSNSFEVWDFGGSDPTAPALQDSNTDPVFLLAADSPTSMVARLSPEPTQGGASLIGSPQPGSNLSPAPPSPGSRKPHQCSQCNASFTYKKDLKRHQRSVHPAENQPFYRCRCGVESVRKDNYLRHVNSCKKQRYDLYSCNCQYSCAVKQDHCRHVTMCKRYSSQRGRPRAQGAQTSGTVGGE
ncbi:hypothetical protein F4777DRAFT_543569 [Nemania sp. FL0916]|nr:hypothetical protein F4777DRAFT_543569 [Nemania sp. FL0916]